MDDSDPPIRRGSLTPDGQEPDWLPIADEAQDAPPEERDAMSPSATLRSTGGVDAGINQLQDAISIYKQLVNDGLMMVNWWLMGNWW